MIPAAPRLIATHCKRWDRGVNEPVPAPAGFAGSSPSQREARAGRRRLGFRSGGGRGAGPDRPAGAVQSTRSAGGPPRASSGRPRAGRAGAGPVGGATRPCRDRGRGPRTPAPTGPRRGPRRGQRRAPARRSTTARAMRTAPRRAGRDPARAGQVAGDPARPCCIRGRAGPASWGRARGGTGNTCRSAPAGRWHKPRRRRWGCRCDRSCGRTGDRRCSRGRRGRTAAPWRPSTCPPNVSDPSRFSM